MKQLLAHFAALDATKTPKELFAADIQKDLLLLEEQEGSVNFKFGVVYMKAGQKCDDEMLSNGNLLHTRVTTIHKQSMPPATAASQPGMERHAYRKRNSSSFATRSVNFSTEHGSEEFEEFLQLLGQRIKLRGWERFRGGLDVKGMVHVACGQRIEFGDSDHA